ncbi:MAG: glycosyltransferase 87 family protein [Propionibacteriaceae bacterium]|nr:glycosyltransferase 87 family protein [Propionibacteriaceae bacterium]
MTATRAPFLNSLNSGLALLLLFLVTRALNIWFWQQPAASFVANDVSYYSYYTWCFDVGLEEGSGQCVDAAAKLGIMAEYPLPAQWLLQLVYWLADGFEHYFKWFAGLMLVLDAVVAASLFRRGNAKGALVWILFTAACGPIMYFRFDLIPAALVAWACLLLAARPYLAGALVAAGAAVKLWPAMLALPLVAPNPLRRGAGRARLLGFLVAGFVLGMSSLLLGGWSRSISPLVWQSRRGLQMESVPATPLMFLRTFTDSGAWPVFLSEWNALELQGPGVGLLLQLSTVLTVGWVVLTAVLSWRLLRQFRRQSPALHEAMLLVILASVLATIVANKTLSPQYILWLAGPLAVLVMSRRSEWLRGPLKLVTVGLVIVAALTQYTYPWGTFGIMGMPNGSPLETSMLILRNLLLSGIAVYTTLLAWRITARSPLHDEVDGVNDVPVEKLNHPAPHGSERASTVA